MRSAVLLASTAFSPFLPTCELASDGVEARMARRVSPATHLIGLTLAPDSRIDGSHPIFFSRFGDLQDHGRHVSVHSGRAFRSSGFTPGVPAPFLKGDGP